MADRVVTQVRPRATLPLMTKSGFEKRVAAYARVSTSSDEQMNSVEAQKDYFQKLITERPGWVLVDIYADEGISGTSLTRRESFNRMIDDAMAGKIDMIITKSLSRFARNTVDTLNTIRKLKFSGVGVYFEKEDIDTLDAKGEFLITLMSSLAEEESRSISENVKWGHRKRFADGKYSMPYKQFLGYKKGADGTPELVEEEAKIIRIIYRLFLEGHSSLAIAKKLTNAGIRSPAGCDTWGCATVDSILQNEKYYGAALLQKRYCVDFRTKKMAPNLGELPKYYIENGHEAIISKDIFDEVQKRFHQRWCGHSTTLIFSHKLYCSDCGGLFGSAPIHSTTYNDIIWRCCNHHLHQFPCTTPYLYEEMLKSIFHQIILSILKQNPGVIRDCIAALKTTGVAATAISKKAIMETLTEHDPNSETEYRIWRNIIQKVIVHPGHLLEFHIIDGTVVPHQMLKTTPRTNRLSQHLRNEIIVKYSTGECASSIARDLGISTDTVRSVISREKQKVNWPTATCQYCGTVFTPHSSKKQKYCSQSCFHKTHSRKESL